MWVMEYLKDSGRGVRTVEIKCTRLGHVAVINEGERGKWYFTSNSTSWQKEGINVKAV